MEGGGESGAEPVQVSIERGSEPSAPFLWSFGDEFVATIALVSLVRTYVVAKPSPFAVAWLLWGLRVEWLFLGGIHMVFRFR